MGDGTHTRRRLQADSAETKTPPKRTWGVEIDGLAVQCHRASVHQQLESAAFNRFDVEQGLGQGFKLVPLVGEDRLGSSIRCAQDFVDFLIDVLRHFLTIIARIAEIP